MTSWHGIICIAASVIALGGCADRAPQQGAAPVAPAATASPPLAPPAARLAPDLGRSAFGASVARAVLTSPDVRIATSEIGSARAELVAAKGAFRPEFSTGLDLQSRYSSRSDSTNSSTSPYVRVSQLIYDGGVARNQRTAATAGVWQARDARLVQAAGAAMAAVEAHVGVLAAQEVLALTQQNLDTHRDYMTQIEERRSVGAGLESDVLTIRSRLADAETRAADAEAGLDQARAIYAEVFDTDPPALSAPPRAPALDWSTERTIAASPRMRSLEGQIEAAEARLRAVRAQQTPRVELGSTALRGDRGGADVVFDISVDYTFDTRQQSSAAIDRAEAELDGLRYEKDRLGRDIRRALDFLASDRTAGERRLTAARAAVEASEANVAAARDEFSIGRRSLLEVLDAQREFLEAQRTLVDARRERLLTGYQALALTGDILDAFGIALEPVVLP